MAGRSDKFDMTTYLESVLENMPDIDLDSASETEPADDSGNQRIRRRWGYVFHDGEHDDPEPAQKK